MKINGITLDLPPEEIFVVQRGSQEIVFKLATVTDYTTFDKLCPRPEPPMVKRGDELPMQDPEDPEYLKQLDEWGLKRVHYIYVWSLRATPGLEWETVDYSKPETWKNWRKELEDSNILPAEISRIQDKIHTACRINTDLLDKATEAFLAKQKQKTTQ